MKESTPQKRQNLPEKRLHSKTENGFREREIVNYSGIVCRNAKTSYEIIIPDAASSELAAIRDEGRSFGRQARKTDLKYSAAPDGIFP